MAGAYPMRQLALLYTPTTLTLSAGQAAGTEAIIAANVNRSGLMFRANANFEIAISANALAGMRIYASSRDSLTGPECPLGDLYLVPGTGLVAGNELTVWEG